MAYIVTGQQYANVAYSYRNSGYTYEQYDCIHFVNLINRDCGVTQLINGTNSSWRLDGNLFTWKGTIQDCINTWLAIPNGALLWRCIPEGEPGYDTIPPQYRGDGIGNFTHIGIRVYPGGILDSGGVMQSGGYGGTGVHYTPWQTSHLSWWTHVSFMKQVQYPGVYNPIDQIVLFMQFNKNKEKPARRTHYRG